MGILHFLAFAQVAGYYHGAWIVSHDFAPSSQSPYVKRPATLASMDRPQIDSSKIYPSKFIS